MADALKQVQQRAAANMEVPSVGQSSGAGGKGAAAAVAASSAAAGEAASQAQEAASDVAGAGAEDSTTADAQADAAVVGSADKPKGNEGEVATAKALFEESVLIEVSGSPTESGQQPFKFI